MTGVQNIDDVGRIQEWNGIRNLLFWENKYANMINGSDGTFFPSIQSKSQSMYVFIHNICR